MPVNDPESRRPTLSRREVLRAGALAAAGLPFATRAAEPRGTSFFQSMGVAAKLDRAAFLKSAGAQFLTESTNGFLVPDQDDAAFAKNLARLAASPLPVLACNGFIAPAALHCVGPDANHGAILAWADVAFRRMALAKGRFIVFGSGKARTIPAGWPVAKAETQFVALLKQLAGPAEKHGIIVVVEQLQPKECNFINRLGDAARLVRATGHPRIRALADFYHMAQVGDTPGDLRAAMDVVVHTEIAEKAGRSAPGVAGDDFRPFFLVLKQAGYRGAINIEGKFTDTQLANAFATIAQQAAGA